MANMWDVFRITIHATYYSLIVVVIVNGADTVEEKWDVLI